MHSVLVVDDDRVLLEMFTLLIEDMGYRVLTASNGQEALDLLDTLKEPPGLIISDIMMPQMDGAEFVRIVKSQTQLTAIPIVLMSAGVRPVGTEIADSFVHKPFSLKALEALIRRYTGSPQ